MAKTNYLEIAILNHVLRNTALASPAAVYVALFTAVTDAEAGTVTEVSAGNGYARVAATFGAPAAGGSTSNSAEVAFGTATANKGTPTHFGIYDASTGGNLLYVAALGSSFAYNTGVTPRFAIGALVVSED